MVHNNFLIQPEAPSLGYSLRRLSPEYTGFAVNVRRAGNNARADVNFDDDNVVSPNSMVTVTFKGSSGFTVGQVLTYSAFKGTANTFVRTWYFQGADTGFNAVQNVNNRQPQLLADQLMTST